MNKKIIYFVIVLILTNCTVKQDKIENTNSKSFNDFLSEFKKCKLPLNIDSNIISRKGFSNNSKILSKYLYDFENIGSDGSVINKNNNTLYGFYLFNRKDKNYISVIYYIYFLNKHEQIILANFSKKTEQRISQLVLYGDDYKTYQLTSSIDTNFIITTKMLNSNRLKWFPPYKKHPDYFFINLVQEKYKINDNGEFEKIDYKDLGNLLSVKEGFKYIYPVEPPEGEYKISLRFDFMNAKTDPDCYVKPPKNYKMSNDSTPIKFKPNE